MEADIPNLVTGTLIGITLSSLFVMFLLVGFSLVFGFPKLRKSGGASCCMTSRIRRAAG